jgi:hypothetical protein
MQMTTQNAVMTKRGSRAEHNEEVHDAKAAMRGKAEKPMTRRRRGNKMACQVS